MSNDDAGSEPLVRLEGLTKHFGQSSGLLDSLFPKPPVRAVDDVTFDIREGETLGLVGESGCGKSTLARTVLRLLDPTDGAVYFGGDDLASLSGAALREKRRDMQMIFQDPQSSLDPRMKVGPIVEEPMRAHGLYEGEREERARDLLEKVGLDPHHNNRYPHQFSGGQRQRINLARALAVNPEFIVCDEPVSALDVSIQAQVLNTMRDLQAEFGLTYLFIAHDLSVIRHISDRVAVMYLGKLVELAETEELFENPQHPYTEALLGSIPVPDPRASGTRGVLEGDVPSPIDPPSGCRLRTRCPALIQPDEYDMPDPVWDRVRTFTRAVDRRTFELPDSGAGADSSASADGDDPRGDDGTLAEWVRAEFFPDGLPAGEPGRIVSEAVAEVVTGEWAAATDRLTGAFTEPSVCAREVPSYAVEPRVGGGEHYAACHLHREDGTPVARGVPDARDGGTGGAPEAGRVTDD